MKYSKLGAVMAVLLTVIFLANCSKSDPAPSIVGTWKIASTVISGCTNPLLNISIPCVSSCEQIVVTSTTITSGGVTTPYTVSGNTVTQTTGGVTSTATFTVTSTTLTLDIGSPVGLPAGCKTSATFTRVL